MPADATYLRCLRRATPTHFTSVFQWAGGVGAEVFGVVGEGESGLFNYSGRKSVEYFGVGN